MQIDVQIIGAKELAKGFKEMSLEVQKELKAEVVAAAYGVRDTAVKGIQGGTKTGKRYVKVRSKKTGKPYRVYIDDMENPPKGIVSISSAEGEFPATDTGTLVNSIKALAKSGLNAEVQANANYSGYLEEDLNRPFLQPSLDKQLPILDKAIDRLLDKAIDNI
jgi:hypothetical protein